MTTVAVTGASGYLGRLVCDELDGREDVRRVIGVDTVEPTGVTRNLEFYRLDVRSSSLVDVLRGCDVVVHLAFSDGPLLDIEEMRDRNVGGTRNVLRAVLEAEVRKVIHVSSVLAYGAHPDNDFPLTESSPIRPVRDLPHSAHAGEAEEIVAGFADAHAGVVVTVFRPAVVCGPTVSGTVGRVLEAPVAIRVTGYDPPVQVLHEKDAAAGIVFGIDNDLAGAYNIAPDDWIDADEALAITGKRPVSIRYEDTSRRLERLAAVGVSDMPQAALPFLMYPWVMSSTKLREAGFACRYGTREALRDAAEASRGWTSLGPLRFRPRRVAAGLAGAALVSGALARRAIRSQRKA